MRTAGARRNSFSRAEAGAGRRVGYDYVHCAVDDHTRLAYAEIHPDEKALTCAEFLRRAAAFFAAHGIARIERVMTDNAFAYRHSAAWREALADLGAQPRHIRPYRPQTNGKAERFNRTLLEEWAYARPFSSSSDRTAALPGWLHTYNHHRTHTALGGHPPISRITVNNGAGHADARGSLPRRDAVRRGLVHGLQEEPDDAAGGVLGAVPRP